LRSGRYYAAVKKDGRKVDVHRKIAAETLGRPLSRSEIVHHKNGNINDNRPENLQVMTRSEHARLHRKGVPLSEAAKLKLSTANKGAPRHELRRLSPKQVQKVYEMRSCGATARGIARHFKISHSSISGILNGHIYREKFPLQRGKEDV